MFNFLDYFSKKNKIPRWEITYAGAYGIDSFLLDDTAEIKREVSFSIANKQLKKLILREKKKKEIQK